MKHDFKLGDLVYVKFTSFWSECTILGFHDELGGTVTVRCGDEDGTCRISELETAAVHEERLANWPRERLKDIVRAWEAGKRTNKEIAEFLGVATVAVVARVAEAKRREYIK